MDQEMLKELLDIAVDNVSEDVASGKYSRLVDREKKTAALALLVESEFLDLVEMTGLINMQDDKQWMKVKYFFEEHVEEALFRED